MINPFVDSLDKHEPDTFMVDLAWFDKINCRQPITCVNFIEYFILDSEDKIIDTIKITSRPVAPNIYPVNKETYDKIKKYMVR